MESIAALPLLGGKHYAKRNRTIASVVCLILVAAMIVTSFVGLGVM